MFPKLFVGNVAMSAGVLLTPRVSDAVVDVDPAEPNLTELGWP